MWISDTSIKRPVFATMVIVSFMVLGIVSLGRLGIDLFPEVNFPFVNVLVPYPGAGPEEVETLVTRPIEDAVAVRQPFGDGNGGHRVAPDLLDHSLAVPGGHCFFRDEHGVGGGGFDDACGGEHP